LGFRELGFKELGVKNLGVGLLRGDWQIAELVLKIGVGNWDLGS
jgi:hypothetical protein